MTSVWDVFEDRVKSGDVTETEMRILIDLLHTYDHINDEILSKIVLAAFPNFFAKNTSERTMDVSRMKEKEMADLIDRHLITMREIRSGATD